MTWKEVGKAVSEDYILTLVVGSTEQHGPHLPVGTDVYIPLGIAEKVASRIKTVIAPPVTYGYYSQVRSGGGGEKFPGTTSVRSSTLVGLITDVMEAFIRHGFRRFIILSGHSENSELIGEGVGNATRLSGDKEVRTLVVNWWDLISIETLNAIYDNNFPGWEIEHAAIAETSMMMALKPELVRTEQIHDYNLPRRLTYDVIPPPKGIIPEQGVSAKVGAASKGKGEVLVLEAVDRLVEAVNKDLAD
jgi:creatinine amidohydrolase